MVGLKAFVPAIGNWAVCDVLCADLKPKPGELGELAAFLESCIATGEEFQVRFGYVARMLYYRGDDWIDETFRLFAAFHHEGYYARMGAAWGISMLFLCQRERTLRFLETDSLDRFTHNKAIQKTIESRPRDRRGSRGAARAAPVMRRTGENGVRARGVVLSLAIFRPSLRGKMEANSRKGMELL